MSFLSHEATQLASSLKAASAYAQQARGNLDLSDPKAAARLRHVQAVEAAVQGAIDFATAADKLLNPPPPPLVAHIRNLPAFQNNLPRLEYPHHIREALALFSAHHLPRNPYLDELFGPAKPEPQHPMGEHPSQNGPAARNSGP
jgi:hypothetical protein